MNSTFTVEKIQQEDKEEVLRLSSNIWEGHDYIPDVFDEWVEDGGFYCGKLDGRIIAIDKLTEQEDGVIWLEGLRVHPDHQGKGYASMMVNELMNILENYDYDTLRFLTTAGKEPVKKIAEDHGFDIKQIYRYLLIDEEDIKEVNINSDIIIEQASIKSDLYEILEFIYSSKEYQENKKQYMAHWTTYDLTDELIKKEIEKGNCYKTKDQGEIDSIIFFYYYEPHDTLSIPFISGTDGRIIELIKMGINKCIDNNYSTYTIKTASERIVNCAKKAGMEPSDHYEILLYEKSR